jgi:16S rRNA (guanine966-N2)-methyltransferase
MRIIGGTHRSRTLLGPRDDRTTRPITDRVKQALFDRLTAMAVLEGAAVDAFAGSGSLGLEALSRGVDHVTFIEKDRAARRLLEQNLEALQLSGQAAVLGVDALSAGWVAMLPHRPVNLVFLDPPYRLTEDPAGMARVSSLLARLTETVDASGVLVLRTDARVRPPAVEGWEGPGTHVYGSMALHFFQRPE